MKKNNKGENLYMKIEILFPEFCNLFGDISNMKYLKKCLPNEEYIETSIEDEPAFLNQDIKFIYKKIDAIQRKNKRINRKRCSISLYRKCFRDIWKIY